MVGPLACPICARGPAARLWEQSLRIGPLSVCLETCEPVVAPPCGHALCEGCLGDPGRPCSPMDSVGAAARLRKTRGPRRRRRRDAAAHAEAEERAARRGAGGRGGGGRASGAPPSSDRGARRNGPAELRAARDEARPRGRRRGPRAGATGGARGPPAEGARRGGARPPARGSGERAPVLVRIRVNQRPRCGGAAAPRFTAHHSYSCHASTSYTTRGVRRRWSLIRRWVADAAYGGAGLGGGRWSEAAPTPRETRRRGAGPPAREAAASGPAPSSTAPVQRRPAP